MPFKIVRTVENKKPQLCICPSQWERSGLLKWPKKCSEKLIKDENASAQPDWREINCIVKRKDLSSYEAADKELRIMLDNTDTENEDGQIQQVTLRRLQQRPEAVNYNNLANHLILQEAEGCGNSSTSTLAEQNDLGETYIILPSDSTTAISTAPDSDNNTLKIILENQSVLFEISNTIVENQKKIMHELASLSVQMEESLSKVNDDRSYVKTLGNCSGTAENNSFAIKQIKNVQDLECMEQLLSDTEQTLKLLNASSFICAGGPGTAKNCAFRFVDVLFSRDFLCLCSWSGSSRSDGVKISLKCYKNALNFFYGMIKRWDESYTIEENEKFFKDVLKNSNKRKNVKYERISTKRRRTVIKNNKSMKKQENEKENEHEEEEQEEESLC